MDSQYPILEHEMKTAMSNLDHANKVRSETADETRKGLAEYYDKILFYAAGSFSFQVALLQIVSDKHVLSIPNVLGIPNVFVMYGSMLFYMLTGALVLGAKKADTYYLSSHSGEFYREKLLKERKATLRFFSTYPQQMLVDGGANAQIATYKSDIKKIEDVKKNLRLSAEFYRKLTVFLNTLVEVFAVTASILLFAFAIQLSQSLVW